MPAFVNEADRVRVARASTCSACGSRSRHRGLVLLLADLAQVGTVNRILHLAPEDLLAEHVRATFPSATYETTDLSMPDVTHPGEDLQALTLPDDAYDLVLRNHVLKHVSDDEAAMSELLRIRSPAGMAIVTVPGDWRRSEAITFDDLSNNGHHRDYGWSVLDTLCRHFAVVSPVDLSELRGGEAGTRYGVRARDTAFCCSRGR